MASENEEWVLAEYPKGPVTASNFALKQCAVPSPGAGQVLLKVLYISVDPYLRIKMYPGKPGAEEPEGEFAPFKIDQPLSSHILGEVIASEAPGFSAGDCVVTVGPWRRFTAVDASACQKVPTDLPLSYYLNVTGLIGLSTYFPVVEIGQPKEGETVFISGAAGAVGSLAGQIFKAFGCRVIGTTSSDNKAEVLRGLGFEVFNYRDRSIENALDELAPEGIDIYWDNVGGPVLDAVLPRMKKYGRIIACGGISQYHQLGSPEQYGVKNLMSVVTNCLKLQGFLAFDYMLREQECFQKLTALVKQGKIKPLETILEGFDKVPQAFMGLFSGENIGKMLVKVAEPSEHARRHQEQSVAEAGAEVEEPLQDEDPAIKSLESEILQTRELIALSKSKTQQLLKDVLKRHESELERLRSQRQRRYQQATSSTTTSSSNLKQAQEVQQGEAARSVSPMQSAAAQEGAGKYDAIDSFAWDQGEYNTPWVYVYVTLDGVGDVKDQVTCDFTPGSFDLKVNGLNGRNFRLLKDQLDKDIVPEESTYIVKKNRMTIKLKKVKGEYSYDHWTDLTAKRKRSADVKQDPMGGIMDMMRDMYDEGDDNTKKMIAEAMMKARAGEKSGSSGFGSSSFETL